jgi:hypothetical protein
VRELRKKEEPLLVERIPAQSLLSLHSVYAIMSGTGLLISSNEAIWRCDDFDLLILMMMNGRRPFIEGSLESQSCHKCGARVHVPFAQDDSTTFGYSLYRYTQHSEHPCPLTADMATKSLVKGPLKPSIAPLSRSSTQTSASRGDLAFSLKPKSRKGRHVPHQTKSVADGGSSYHIQSSSYALTVAGSESTGAETQSVSGFAVVTE